MDISLTPEMARYVQDKIAAGQFSSSSEVINSALAVLKESEALTPDALEQLRREIDIGLTQLNRGQGQPWDPEEMKARIRQVEAKDRRAS